MECLRKIATGEKILKTKIFQLCLSSDTNLSYDIRISEAANQRCS